MDSGQDSLNSLARRAVFTLRRRWFRFVFFWGGLMLFGVNCGWGQWTEPQLFPVEHGTAIRGPWISNDDLRMYAAFTGYIFVAERASVDSPWTPFHTVGDHINSGIRQESPCESPTGDTLYFMSYERPEGSYGGYDIYYTIKTDSGWFGPIINCGENINSEFTEWSVGISRDGTKLLICSDRIPGGTMNLYFCDKQTDGSWGSLTSFGPEINTGRDEEHASLSPDNSMLYFYKLGPRNGDIWMSLYNNGWLPAMTLADPPNSLEWTESDPCVSADGRTLYFISNRADGPGYQLYQTTDTTLGVDEHELPRSMSLSFEPSIIANVTEQRIVSLTIQGWDQQGFYATHISDLLGRTIFHNLVQFERTEEALKGNILTTQNLPAGSYFVRVNLRQTAVSHRFDVRR